MAFLVRDDSDRPARDYPSLYFELCNCAGPQPSLNNSRADEHVEECPYRGEVEGDGNSHLRGE